MTLQSRLLRILGEFWSSIWKQQGIVKLLTSAIESLVGTDIRDSLNSLKQSIAIMLGRKYPNYSRHTIYIPVNEYREAFISPISTNPSSIRPGYTTRSNLWSCAFYGTKDAKMLELSTCVDGTTDTAVLVQDVDFYYAADRIFFRRNIASLYPKTVLRTVDGVPMQCYQITGYCYKQPIASDVYTALLHPDMQIYADKPQALSDIWQLRNKGPSIYLVKRYIGNMIKVPVAQNESQTVRRVSTEEGYNVVYTDKRCYVSKASASVSSGDTVTYGTPLFNGPLVITKKDVFPTQADMPVMPVYTLAGSLYARNHANSSLSSGKLPLYSDSGYTTLSQDYKDLVDQYADKPGIYTYTLPSSLNPATWIFGNIYRSYGVLILLPFGSTYDSAILSEMCSRIEQSIGSSAVVTILQQSSATSTFDTQLQAYAEPVGYLV